MKIERLEEIRNELGLNKSQFAELMGISRHYYYQILSGGDSSSANLRLEHLENLLITKRVNPAWVMTGEGEKFIVPGNAGLSVDGQTAQEPPVVAISKKDIMRGVMRYCNVPAVQGDLAYDLLDNLVTKTITGQSDFVAQHQQHSIQILSNSWISMLELVQSMLDQDIEFQYGEKKYRFRPQ